MNEAHITELVEGYLKGSDRYPTDVRLEPGERIVVEIDGDTPVSIDDCTALSEYIESQLDRDVEDYELEVGSAGISAPFKTLRQYRNAVGKAVEILQKNGEKCSGALKSADEKGVVLAVQKQVKPEGAKRKVTIEEDVFFCFNEIKYTKYIIKL
jgi:ribosome maturation factor RimP